MRIQNGSRYTLNCDNLNLNYVLSIANFHNSAVITKINGINRNEIPVFKNQIITMFDLPEVINEFPANQPFIVECDSDGQGFGHIIDALGKHGGMESYERSQGAWQFKLPNGECTNTLKIYKLNNTGKFIFPHNGSLLITDQEDVQQLSDVGFDVDEGFYAKIEDHPHQACIAELQQYYQKYCANNGLEKSTVSNAGFVIPTEKQLDEFYKKEFGGFIFSPQNNPDKPGVAVEPVSTLKR